MKSEIGETWHISNKMNYLLLDAITDDAMSSRYSAKTRSVSSQFAHMHNVRVSHLEARGTKFKGDLKGFSRGAEPGKKALQHALQSSESAIADYLRECEQTGRVKGWNGSPTTYLSYFVAHESHHRGLVLVSLRLSGVKLPKEVTYGIWYWRKRKNIK